MFIGRIDSQIVFDQGGKLLNEKIQDLSGELSCIYKNIAIMNEKNRGMPVHYFRTEISHFAKLAR